MQPYQVGPGIQEGQRVYVIANTSEHPFKINSTIWVLYKSGEYMLTCWDYHKTFIGYLTMDEVDLHPVAPKRKRKRCRTEERARRLQKWNK